jgi:hypothetical protein
MARLRIFFGNVAAGPAVYNDSVIEVAAAADAQAALTTAVAAITEAAAAADTPDAGVVRLAAITEAAAATDAQDATVIHVAGITEPATATDTPGATMVAIATITEAAAAASFQDASVGGLIWNDGVTETAQALDQCDATIERRGGITARVHKRGRARIWGKEPPAPWKSPLEQEEDEEEELLEVLLALL